MSIGALVGGAFGGVAGYFGARSTNRSNERISSARNLVEREEALKARTFSAEQAQLNRDYTERLSSTSVQRRMKDMKKAGINPILAGKFEASTPSGSQPATSKANAHGYTAINQLQPVLDNLATAVNLKQAYHQAEKTGYEAKTAQNTANITTTASQGATLAQKGITGVKNFAEGLGTSAAQIKMHIDKQIQSLSKHLGNSKRPTKLNIKINRHNRQLGDK